jgi:hypothetical protein
MSLIPSQRLRHAAILLPPLLLLLLLPSDRASSSRSTRVAARIPF